MAIKFDNKAPEWDNLGAEPDAELKKGGFLAGYKPPAAYFNWFFNRTYECVKELQEKLVSNLKSLAFKDKVGDDDITAVAANKVTQDSKHRMITDAERSTWNGKADASGGDVSEMTVKTLETITTEFPVPVAGECTKTFLGKVKKFFEDTKNWMTGVCLIGQIVNNCVTNNAKLPLSAAQGKVLMDLYTVLNTKIIYVDTPSVPITASAGQSWFADIPFTKQDGYIPISATINCTGGNSQAYIIGIHQLTNGSVRVAFQNYSGSPQTINISAKVVLIKQT
jgi:hypothetical protein